jgi:pimeloyl-ACP methyl ester carboxylesterase
MTRMMSTRMAAVGLNYSIRCEVRGRPAEIHVLGQGEPILLLHGGWAGARAHWQAVWLKLAETFRVITPELPGVVNGSPLESYVDYAAWVAEVLDTLGTGPVLCVGNSLGAIIAWCLASQAPARVRKLVLVDGGLIEHDRMCRLLLALPWGVHLLKRLALYNTFSSSTLQRAFADPSRAPTDLVEALSQPPQARFELMFNLFLRGAPCVGAPQVPVLVAWGRQDRLIGWTTKTGERLARRIPGATLYVFDHAGHLPQVEQPEEFVSVLRSFASG